LTFVYRIVRRPYAKKPLDGEGAYRFGGRWSSPGTRIVYTSEHSSLAMLEYFVHIDPDDPPKDLMLITISIPATVQHETHDRAELPKNWRRSPAPSSVAAVGDDFIRQERTAVLVVPSAVAPMESNWLINPIHPASKRITIKSADRFVYDPRLMRF
jgi:RES domain-containing protein